MEDVRSLSIIGQRTFDKDSFGYDRLGEIAQVAERALSVNATNVVRHDLERQVEVNDILSQELGLVDLTQQYPPSRPSRRSRRSQLSTAFIPSVFTSFIPSVSTSFFADPTDGYQRHEEQGSSQTLGTPPLAVSKGQRVTKEPDRLTYSHFRAKKPKKK
ncbi:OLC1v1025226C1 [Oldenlandia corymbosa var. corymbosa]|uniref:OLC1v1025226C1 n=1 Tax=Oldenlandia corymbosa var. corymbosa TaxID=529605 RepID=A0AAV1C492_OLDCO|nr:OLC1v1025226C1 [Oldenlandia corymbosa var. corymbosa]